MARERTLQLAREFERDGQAYPADLYPYRAQLEKRHYPEAQVEAFANQPIDLDTLLNFQVKTGTKSDIVPNHVRPAVSLYDMQCMPFSSEAEVMRRQGGIEEVRMGRLFDIKLAVSNSKLGEVAHGLDTVSVENVREADGELARQMLSRETRPGKYNRYENMTGATVIVELDHDAPIRRAADGQEYDEFVDLKVVDVVTTEDAFPSTINIFGAKPKPDENGEVREWAENNGLLTEYAANYEAELIQRYAKKFGKAQAKEAFETIVDQYYVAFARLWRGTNRTEDKLPVASSSNNEYNKEVEDFLIRFGHHGGPQDPPELQTTDRFHFASVPLRAYTELLNAWEKYGTKAITKEEFGLRRQAIRREVVQALAVHEYLMELNEENRDLMMQTGQLHEPSPRWTFDQWDPMSRDIAMELVKYSDPRAQMAGALILQTIPETADFSIRAQPLLKPQNFFTVKQSKSGPLQDCRGIFYGAQLNAKAEGMLMTRGVRYDGSRGTFPGDNYDTLCNHTVPDYGFRGIAAQWTTFSKGEGKGRAKSYWALDLLKLPGNALLMLDALGYMDGSVHTGVKGKAGKADPAAEKPVYLSQLLDTRDLKPIVAITTTNSATGTMRYHSPVLARTAVRISIDEDFKPKKEDQDSEASDARRIVTTPMALDAHYDHVRAQIKQTAGQTALAARKEVKAAKKATAGQVVPIRRETERNLKDILSVVRYGDGRQDTLYLQQANGSRDIARVRLMRSERPPQKKVIL